MPVPFIVDFTTLTGVSVNFHVVVPSELVTFAFPPRDPEVSETVPVNWQKTADSVSEVSWHFEEWNEPVCPLKENGPENLMLSEITFVAT